MTDTSQPQEKHNTPMTEADASIGAVETERAEDQAPNPHDDALDENGMPKNTDAICEDVIGANVDGTQG